MDDYDLLAEKYGTYEQISTTDWTFGLSIIFDSIVPVKDKVILDYGCGTGRFSRFLSKHGAKLVSVDISKNMIQYAKQQELCDIKYYEIESAKLDFIENRSIDLIIASYVICTVASSLEIIKIFKEMHRVLKPGGKLFILDNHWENSHGKEFISHKLGYQDNLKSGQEVEVTLKVTPPLKIKDYFWSKNDYCTMLNKAGFLIQSIQEPLATDNKYAWIDEKYYSPCLIITGDKL